jgi:anti-sigma factor RsiW
MDCHSFRSRMSPWLDGGLPPDQAGALADHVASCATCAKAWEALRAVDAALRGVPVPPEPAGLEDRVLRAVRSRAAASHTPRPCLELWGLRLAGGLACVAAVWLGVVGGGNVSRHQVAGAGAPVVVESTEDVLDPVGEETALAMLGAGGAP